MVELIFKTVITIVIIVFLSWLWSRQLDMKAIVLGPFKRGIHKPAELLPEIDQNAIYQNGKIVGRVSGMPEERDESRVFPELYDTAQLDRSQSFEYRREKLKIVKIEGVSGASLLAIGGMKQAVMTNVVCEKLK